MSIYSLYLQFANFRSTADSYRPAAGSLESPANGFAQMIGTTVLQRFELNDRLGAGGFGTVYRAWDRRLERSVAVKVIETGPQSGPRIQREAQAAARLNHPGIVTLFEFAHHEFGGREGGRAFLVSELVDGETVRQMIDDNLLSDREVAEIGADICEALDHAHSRGVVHRDLKPANLICPFQNSGAKLMDFGVARLTDGDDLTNTGDVLGTLSYMAPEQAEGMSAGPPADVYSLALTLFEAWSGVNPRRQSSPGATLRALDRDLPSLSRLRPDLPCELCDLIDSCLDREPEFRPDIETLGVRLEGCLELLDEKVPDQAHQAESIFSFADRGFDSGRILAAAGIGGIVATVMTMSGAADPPTLAVFSLVTSMLSLLNARLGFLVAAGGLAAWLSVVAGMPGAGLLVAMVGVPAAIFTRGSGRPLVFGPLAPLLGTFGAAPFTPLLAAFACDWRDRAIVASTGLAITALAEAATGRKLLFGKFTEVAPGWQDSPTAAVSDLLLPTLFTVTFAVSLVLWVTVAVLVGAIVNRALDRREAGRAARERGGLTFSPVGSTRVPNTN
jgi:hypothetical protein